MKQLYRVCLMMVMVLVGLSVGGEETAVFAQTNPPLSASWVVRVSVENWEPQIIWQVVVKNLEDDSLFAQSEQPLQCEFGGGVTIHQDHLSFNGQRPPIWCKLPSFAEEVARLTNKMLILPDEEKVNGTLINAEMSLTPSSLQQKQMSLFSHVGSNFHYDIHLLPNGDFFPANARQVFAGEDFFTRSSVIFDAPQAQTTLKITLDSFGFTHFQNDEIVGADSSANSFLLNTQATTICIGCGPAGYFTGVLWYGEFDPGCTGICGL
ncbi:MAG: hypothetical protein KDE56_00475 [Anaerolineales bacterium]|nr:hypothetical protein [Anaerolineales bacterium]